MWREGDEGEEGEAGRGEGTCREGKGESETEKGLVEPPRFDCVSQNDKVCTEILQDEYIISHPSGINPWAFKFY